MPKLLRKCLTVATFKRFLVESGLRFALGPLEVSVRYFWILPNRTEPNRKYRNTEILVFSVRFGRTLVQPETG